MAEKPVVTCPACEKKFKAKADVRGKKILCPFCDQSFVVPADDGASSTAIQDKGVPVGDPGTIPLAGDPGTIPLAGDHARVTAPPDEEEQDNDNPYGVTHIDLDPRCPNCTEKMVPKNAVVCLNCGYNTLTREWGKTEKTIGVSFGKQFVYLMPGFLAFSCLISWIVGELIFAVYWPFWVAGVTWLDWSDHESLRMWSVTVGMGMFFALARICYRRFILKPLPDEVKVE
jgi:DNA-directed RNA polymerase subunit RPC12/RpoP